MDFAKELQKLLDAEEYPPVDPLLELARAQAGMMETINKNGTGVSMQVEELYDIVKESDDNSREVKNAEKRESQLLCALIAMCDLLDDLTKYVLSSGAGHAETINAKIAEIMNNCGLERVGYVGERLDPRLHTVSDGQHSDAPLETILYILQCGYEYRGTVIRKATVLISKGR